MLRDLPVRELQKKGCSLLKKLRGRNAARVILKPIRVQALIDAFAGFLASPPG